MPHTQMGDRDIHDRSRIKALHNELVDAIDDLEAESVDPVAGAAAHSGAGATSIAARTNLVTSTGATEAQTLADGDTDGQRVRIMHTVDGGSLRLTAGGSLHLDTGLTSITLANRWDWVELEWLTDKWRIVGVGGVGTNGVTVA